MEEEHKTRNILVGIGVGIGVSAAAVVSFLGLRELNQINKNLTQIGQQAAFLGNDHSQSLSAIVNEVASVYDEVIKLVNEKTSS